MIPNNDHCCNHFPENGLSQTYLHLKRIDELQSTINELLNRIADRDTVIDDLKEDLKYYQQKHWDEQ